jgi:Xaa-Pro aminopeptidase
VVAIATAPERTRNADSHYDYRWDSGFYYLTGFREPEAVLVMVLGRKPRSILFCREKNLEREIWDGFRFGPDLAKEAFGFDEAHPIARPRREDGRAARRPRRACTRRSAPMPPGTRGWPAGSTPCAPRCERASRRPRRSATCARP